MRRFAQVLISIVMIASAVQPALAGGDAAKGQTVFARCLICHTVEKGGANKIGPNLFGVYGRKAASLPNFSYSVSLKNAALVWSEPNLDAFITNPRAKVPGTKMAFAGLSNATLRADVIAYLATLK